MQLDRTPSGIRTRKVRLFGGEGEVPEGPSVSRSSRARRSSRLLRAASAIELHGGSEWPHRRPKDADLGRIDVVAQELADTMTRFVERHPTQWFHFDRSDAK